MLWQKYSIRSIATALNRSASTISREINRSLPEQHRRYTPRLAYEKAIRNRKKIRGQGKLAESYQLRLYTVSQLKSGWSPEYSPIAKIYYIKI